MSKRPRPLRYAIALVAALTAVTVPASAAEGPAVAGGYDIVWDDFRAGFSHTGENAKWSLSPTGALPHGDGRPTTSASGLTVVPTGTDPATGRPAFAFTGGQESAGGIGDGDHLKWYAVANHRASTGVTGFDAVPGQVLTCRTQLASRTTGADRHPFGTAVTDARDDLRLGAGAMSVIDFETNLVFDFFVTDERVHAFYERLPTPGSTYAAFSYALPVATRDPGRRHDLAIAFDRAAGKAVWKVDGREVLAVDDLGHVPADRSHLILDHGGTEETVSPRQLSCGIGMFTLLDAAGPDGRGLVRLSDRPDYYYDPARGAPRPERFLDDASRPDNRLWGQGVKLQVGKVAIASRPGRL
ncbi:MULTISPECIES: DUF6081 family protein [Streptomyces]|uniref:DUF6081 family protein n=1 Tax=Streptomyces TaxID=1883 RepID=UPI0013706F8E|nr:MULTISPECIES: DUF6081 family protein [Streptomyces]MYV74812.1 hypothetical protein [Streptomyces sp. SID1046]WSC79938.1 DUF6081 family protein [Streptomyces virginiae]